MKNAELINTVAEKTGLTKVDVKKVVDAATESIKDALAKGEKVTISDIGIFSTQERPERDGRNPATGATIRIPAKTVVKFKAGKALSDFVNS